MDNVLRVHGDVMAKKTVLMVAMREIAVCINKLQDVILQHTDSACCIYSL